MNIKSEKHQEAFHVSVFYRHSLGLTEFTIFIRVWCYVWSVMTEAKKITVGFGCTVSPMCQCNKTVRKGGVHLT